MAVCLDFCRSAVVKAEILGLWLALAMVVLASLNLVYPLGDYWLVVVAGLVGLVGLGVVDFPLDFLAILVDHSV